jgi:hypothetical protein
MNTIKKKYEPQSNVSNPLQNTRSDGQWNYQPVKKGAFRAMNFPKGSKHNSMKTTTTK